MRDCYMVIESEYGRFMTQIDSEGKILAGSVWTISGDDTVVIMYEDKYLKSVLKHQVRKPTASEMDAYSKRSFI